MPPAPSAAPSQQDVAPAPPPPPPAPAAAGASSGYAPPSAPQEEDTGATMTASFRQAAPGAPVTPAAAVAPRGAGPKAPAPTTPKPVEKAPATAPVAPLLIYTGELALQVDEGEVALTIDKAISLAESLGGYLAGRKDTSVQVRVPSARFRDAFTHLEKLGEVLHRGVTADDVSEQYSDLEVRLTNLRATRQRLQELLARAGAIPDVLQVEKELERVAAEESSRSRARCASSARGPPSRC